MVFRFLTSGESHGPSLAAIIEGVPAGFHIDEEFINLELKKRQTGYGRGGRMSIEKDTVNILSGVRFSKTIGSPICLQIINKDWENWTIPMSVQEVQKTEENELLIKEKSISKIRPGHADFAGCIKYAHKDIRNILERSSARETTTRVAVGAVAKLLLKEFDINGYSFVSQIGNAQINKIDYKNIDLSKIENSDLRCPDDEAYEEMKKEIDKAKQDGDTLGGSFEIIFKNLPVGLGSHVHWDRKLDGLLAQAIMSIPAVKSVEIGLGSEVASRTGSETHDEVFYKDGQYYRVTNNAGGIEGGMTNGEDLIIKASMKAIPTMQKQLNSVCMETHEAYKAHFERSDTCAVAACAVVAENMAAIVLTDSFLQKFGQDNLEEIKTNYNNYIKTLATR